ncbi:MAG: RNA methyltransferase [Candidatus Bipolaricaulota bacterium]
MLSQRQRREIARLRERKGREDSRRFVVEGDKIVRESLADGWPVVALYATRAWLDALTPESRAAIPSCTEISSQELRSLSLQPTPQGVMAVLECRIHPLNWNEVLGDLTLGLAEVQDPGNFGTLLRSAAWFGVRHILASPGCVDATHPKVLQASMGAFLRVRVHTVDLETALAEARRRGVQSYATEPRGTSLFDLPLARNGLFLFGNESRGLPVELARCASQSVGVPSWSHAGYGIDSLNVAAAAAVVCAEVRRRAAALRENHGSQSVQ